MSDTKYIPSVPFSALRRSFHRQLILLVNPHPSQQDTSKPPSDRPVSCSIHNCKVLKTNSLAISSRLFLVNGESHVTPQLIVRYNVHPDHYELVTDRFLSDLEAFSRTLSFDNGYVPLTPEVSCNGDLVDQLGIVASLADSFAPHLTQDRGVYDSADAQDCAPDAVHLWEELVSRREGDATFVHNNTFTIHDLDSAVGVFDEDGQMKYTGTVELHSIEGAISHSSVERGPPSAAEQVMDVLGQKERILLGAPLDALSRAVDILRSQSNANGSDISQQRTASLTSSWRERTPLDIPLEDLPSAMKYLSSQYLSGAQT